MTTDSRASMVRSAASLIRTRGVTGTSLADVLADSGAPRGSIYHHFPRGKDQLAGDAIGWTSERVLAHQRDLQGDHGQRRARVLHRHVAPGRAGLDGTAGCVVAGVAIDTVGETPGLMDVVRATFRSWIDLLSDQLAATGIPAERASAIAVATVAGMEGALILCRAEGDGGPLETVAAELMRLLSARAPAKRRTSRR